MQKKKKKTQEKQKLIFETKYQTNKHLNKRTDL